MNRNELLKRVNIDELDEENRELAELIGMDSYLRLVSSYGGTYVYVPKVETITMRIRDKIICEEYNGHNINALALKYNLSASRINDIVSEKKDEIKRKPLDGQMGLFEN